MIKYVIRLPVPALVFYPIMAYQCHFHEVVGIINMFFLEKVRMELNSHHYDVTDVDVFYVFYHTKMMSDTKTDSVMVKSA